MYTVRAHRRTGQEIHPGCGKFHTVNSRTPSSRTSRSGRSSKPRSRDTLSREERKETTRRAIVAAVQSGIPVPCMGAALSYFDGYRSERLPANLLQAQRDYFGAHTYQRVDKEGVFHTNWME